MLVQCNHHAKCKDRVCDHVDPHSPEDTDDLNRTKYEPTVICTTKHRCAITGWVCICVEVMR